ncbi:MAG: NUDIX domain-containing protein [Candidatus Taylorbacteria bacterium]|nr:NUDIX domain-containing protein [Candidatus Taylorbacteria bacterium]
MRPKKATVSYILRERDGLTEVLLYPRLNGSMAGFLIGPGGTREGDESSQETAVRETTEETRLVFDLGDVEECGALLFDITQKHESWLVMMSRVRKWSGSPEPKLDSGLGNPEWHDITRLPEECFAPGDFLWIHQVLQGKPIAGSFQYGKNSGDLLSHNISF